MIENLTAAEARNLVAASKKEEKVVALEYIWRKTIYPAASRGESTAYTTDYGFGTKTKFEALPELSQDIYSTLLQMGYNLELKCVLEDMHSYIALKISW